MCYCSLARNQSFSTRLNWVVWGHCLGIQLVCPNKIFDSNQLKKKKCFDMHAKALVKEVRLLFQCSSIHPSSILSFEERFGFYFQRAFSGEFCWIHCTDQSKVNEMKNKKLFTSLFINTFNNVMIEVRQHNKYQRDIVLFLKLLFTFIFN